MSKLNTRTWLFYEIDLVKDAVINIEDRGHSIYSEVKRLKNDIRLSSRSWESIRSKINKLRKKWVKEGRI